MKQQQLRPTDIFGIPPVDPKQEVGLEIECEGRKLISGGILSYWSMHQDPSLRGEENMEYTLKQPVKREKVELVVEYLQKKFKEHGTVLKPSNRTSLHTHINVQSLTMKQIAQFVVAYMIVENSLVGHCGEWRKGNLFCLRSSEAEFLVRYFEAAIRNDNYAPLASDEIRYSSCNLAAVAKFGSLEFRSHPSTVDAEEISRWVTMLLEVKDWSQKFEDPTEIIKAFSELGPKELLKVIGPVIYKTVGQADDLEYQMTEGMRLAQSVAFATKWLPTPERKPENPTITITNTGGEAPRPFVQPVPRNPFAHWAVPEPQPLQPAPLPVEQFVEARDDPFPRRDDFPNWHEFAVAVRDWEERHARDVARRQPGPVAGPIRVAPAAVRVEAVPPAHPVRVIPVGTRKYGREVPALDQGRSVWQWNGFEWRLM